ncbi:MAG: nuclear transport factor 2 family protein [Ginsengibacter sp.]
MKRKFSIIIFGILFFLNSSHAQSNDETAVRQILSTQEKAWNSGDIASFMQGYWKSDSLMFIGKSGVTYGWQKTLNNYKKNYPDTVAMGNLTFNLLEVKSLLPEYYFVTGKFHLQRTIGNLEGYFTLLFRKINGHWFIVKDHSS